MLARLPAGTAAGAAVPVRIVERLIVRVRLRRVVERLHRQFLEVVKLEIEGLGIHDINNVQGMMLFNIGDAEMTVGELTLRGCYLGSNVSYNVQKMVENGYLARQRSLHDPRQSNRKRGQIAGQADHDASEAPPPIESSDSGTNTSARASNVLKSSGMAALPVEESTTDADRREAKHIDDVAANVDAARRFGIHAIRFTTPATLRAELAELRLFPAQTTLPSR
jgi:hypothetical protein